MSCIKRIVSFILALILVCALIPCAFAEEGRTFSTPAQILNYGLRDDRGPICIVKSELHRGEKTDDVYLIVLAGSKLSFNQKNNFTAFFASSLSLPTAYLAAVKDAALKVIPEGSKIVLAGHSAGGTMAQQFAADRQMRDRYDILNVLTCGSPTIVVCKREGTLHRLADVCDPIPQISLAGPVNLFYKVSYANSKLLLELQNPHQFSYFTESTWAGYDCLGIKGGSAYLTCVDADCVNFSLKY